MKGEPDTTGVVEGAEADPDGGDIIIKGG